MNRLKPTKGTKLYHRGKQEIVTVIEVEYKYDPCGFVIQTKEGFNFVLMTYNSTWIWDYITTE